MNRSLLAASWFAVRRAPLLVPVLAAVVLVAATVHVQGDGHAVQVLRGVGVLLACGWLSSIDDPVGEVAAASPYPRPVRTLSRVAAGLLPVLPVWLAAAAVAQWRLPGTPVAGLGLEALALGAAGLAIAAGLRAWTGHLTPSYLAVVGLLGLALSTSALPRGWAMLQEQLWGPPWQAAQLRWAALLLVAVGILALAVRDPLAERRRAGVVSPPPLPAPAPPARRRDGSATAAGSGRFAGSR
jgi:hypothetical protein